MLKGRVDLEGIVTAPIQAPDVLVGDVRDHGPGLGVLAEEVLPCIGPALGLAVLVFAVDRLFHQFEQFAGLVLQKKRIPISTPDQLDHFPAGTAEGALQLLDDAAVAAHRTIQALQVAVDHKGQIVEIFATGQADGAQRFGFIHFTVADEGVDPLLRTVLNAPVGKIFQKAGLEDGRNRSQPHGHRGKLPVVGQQTGMWVGGQALAVHFLAKVVQLVLRQPSLQEGPSIDAGRAVPLKVDQIAPVRRIGAAKEVIEGDVVDGGRGREAGDVPAQFQVFLGRPQHHGHGIPADEGANPSLQRPVSRHLRFLPGSDGVGIGRSCPVGEMTAAAPRLVDQLLDNEVGPIRAILFDDGIDRFDPFVGFIGVYVHAKGVRHSVFLL